MKNIKLVLFSFFSLIAIGLLSCSKEDNTPAAPVIELVHLGTHDSPDDKIVYINDAIHLEAKIVAKGLIKKIDLEIAQKSGYSLYNNKTTYTADYEGLGEATFHDHPIIPTGSAIGQYHLTITVTDQHGQQGIVESDFEVKAAQEGGGEHEHEH